VETGCGVDCPVGEVCNGSECVPSACENEVCSNGAWCDPVTGDCMNDPCAGVLCPSDQECEGGECVQGSGGSGGTGGSGGAGGSGGTAGSGGDAGTGGTAGGTSDGGPDGSVGEDPKGNWGLATGGGGCACETGIRSNKSTWMALLGILGLAAMMKRRSSRRGL